LRSLLNLLVIRTFAFIWKRRLHGKNYWPYQENTNQYAKVVRVKGWRTALIDPPCSGRVTNTFMFRFYRWYV